MTPTAQKIDTRSLTPKQLQDLRLRAVKLVDGGLKQAAVARQLGVRNATVCEWMALWREGGEEALTRMAPKGPAPGTTAILTAKEARMIAGLITDRNPEQLKLPFMLWTAAAVGDLIFERTGKRLADRTVRELLRKWGFTPQRPARSAAQRDDQAVTTWQRQVYPRVRREAKARGAVAVFLDETGLRSDAAAPRVWAPKGKTPVAKTPGRRFGLNLVCALLPTGENAFFNCRGRFNTEVFLDFLSRLDAQCGHRPLDIVMDNHPVHKSRAVREWFAQRAPRLRAVHLPPYAPEINPVELMNNDLKTNWIAPLRPQTPEEMEAAAESYRHLLDAQPSRVRAFFEAENTRYTIEDLE